MTSLAHALQLDEAETAHLFDLARLASSSPRVRKPRTPAAATRPSIQRVPSPTISLPLADSYTPTSSAARIRSMVLRPSALIGGLDVA